MQASHDSPKPRGIDLCFCTLALGREYSAAARLLAEDVAKYCPDIRIVVLSDQPQMFDGLANTDFVKFRSNSPVGCYHDKRYCISEGLRRATVCCYLDADCRLLAAPPHDAFTGYGEGIVAWNVREFIPRFASERSAEDRHGSPVINNCDRRLSLSRTLANRLNVNLEQTKFLSEVLICVSRETPNVQRFLQLWDMGARFMQVRGYGWGEGETIGIVAEHLGWKVVDVDPSTWLFKDVLTPISRVDAQILELRRQRLSLRDPAESPSRFRRIVNMLLVSARFMRDSNRRHLLGSSEFVS